MNPIFLFAATSHSTPSHFTLSRRHLYYYSCRHFKFNWVDMALVSTLYTTCMYVYDVTWITKLLWTSLRHKNIRIFYLLNEQTVYFAKKHRKTLIVSKITS